MRWLDDITNSMDMNLKKIQEIVKDREAWPEKAMAPHSSTLAEKIPWWRSLVGCSPRDR